MKTILNFVNEKLALCHYVNEKLTLNNQSKIKNISNIEKIANYLIDHNLKCQCDMKECISEFDWDSIAEAEFESYIKWCKSDDFEIFKDDVKKSKKYYIVNLQKNGPSLIISKRNDKLYGEAVKVDKNSPKADWKWISGNYIATLNNDTVHIFDFWHKIGTFGGGRRICNLIK